MSNETPNPHRTIQPVMISFDRSPGENYLERTLDNLESSIGCEVDNLIVCDSHNSAYVSSLALRREGCVYEEHEHHVCANLNVVHALEAGVVPAKLGSKPEFVLFLEDDIDFVGDFFGSVARWLDDHVSSLPLIYPLGANYGEVQQAYSRGETHWSYPVTKFYGTQAFLIRARDVESCCEYIRSHCYDLHDDGTGYDHLIRDWMLSNGITHVPTPCPSFVQHIGTTSIIKRRTAIHTFPSFLGRDYTYKGVDEINSSPTVCVVTPARNASAHLDLYFEQLGELRNALEPNYRLRLIVAEGDSTDNTRELLQQHAQRLHLDYTLVDTTHGERYYRSVEDPKRMAMMSRVMGKALGEVGDGDDVVVWLMVDVRYDVTEIAELVWGAATAKHIAAPLALNNDGSALWDSWAFRKDGKRFSQHPPYTDFNETGLTEIDSAGTCLVIPGEIARDKFLYPSQDEAVEFCNNARAAGYKIYTNPSWCVYHNYHPSKRALVLGNFGSTSGYSRCTASLLPCLSSKGYEIDLIAIDWLAQRPNNFPWNIWGAVQLPNDAPRGASQLYRMLVSSRYDVCVVLTDVFDIPAYAKAILDARKESPNNGSNFTIAWCAVDSNNQLTTPALNAKDDNGNRAFNHVITWTEFAREELIVCGCEIPIDVIPLGVDTEVFSFNDGDVDVVRDARTKLLVEHTKGAIPASILDAFIVGFVGRNQQRKRPDLAIAAFAKFLQLPNVDENNTYLILHCSPGNGPMGCDTEGVGQFYNLPKGSLILYETLLDDHGMALFYKMLDVLIVTSTGEGFCLPVLESLACGTPVIIPDYGPLAEWSKGNVLAARTIADAPIAPSNTAPFTMGRLVDVEDVARCLDIVYEMGNPRRASGRRLAESLDKKLIYEQLATRIDELAARKEGVCDESSLVAWGEHLLSKEAV